MATKVRSRRTTEALVLWYPVERGMPGAHVGLCTPAKLNILTVRMCINCAPSHATPQRAFE